MKISAISDVHVKVPHDDADQLLVKFLTHPQVRGSDYVLLLGDIFDLMVGPHKEYLRGFSHLFDLMDELVQGGSKLYYFEGNHDLHLQELFRQRWPNGEVTVSQFPLRMRISDKEYYFSHGDEHDILNHPYQRYKKFILTSPLAFIANHLMPYWILHAIGERASRRSRKKGYLRFDEARVRETFRNGVLATTAGEPHVIIGGHSHVQDIHQLPGKDSLYVNNGFALATETFILVVDHVPRFEPLV